MPSDESTPSSSPSSADGGATAEDAAGGRVASRPVLEVEVWSDVVCPWCYIGKVRFDRAVAEVADDVEVRVRYRPYQLDPRAPLGEPTPVADAYAKKFGGVERAAEILQHVTRIAAEEGIEFRMDRALRANTLLAHRLLWLAEATGGQAELKARLLAAYFTDGADIGSADALADVAAEVGFDRERVRAFLASDDGVGQVGELLDLARDEGITAVPTYVFTSRDGQRWMVPGAQDTALFARALRRLAGVADVA